MSDNRKIVTEAFEAWSDGVGYVSSIFADDMTWEIVGRSAASKKYPHTQAFVDEVLAPFGARFSSEDPFRPINIRGIIADDLHDTVVVIWDGRGTTITGSVYENTYAWVMRLRDGEVVDGVAFYDSIAFNELWADVQPRS